MDLGRIISRSFEITTRYRALWVFGVLLALFGGSSPNIGNGANFNFGGTPRGQTLPGSPLPGGPLPQFPAIATNTILLIAGVVVCVVLILAVLSIILRFASRGALIGLVQELEATQAKPTVRHGFDIGFDRFGSLLGIGLLINIPLFIVSVLLVLLALVPLFASLAPFFEAGRFPQQFPPAAGAGIAGSVILVCCVVLFLWLVQVVIQPFYEFFMRACVIGRRGAVDAIREGYRIASSNIGNVILLYIVLIGVSIAYFIIAGVIVLAILALIAGIGFAVGYTAQNAMPGVIVAVVLGIPAFVLFLIIGGIYQVFESAMWTEGYLSLTAPSAPAVQEPAAAPA